MQTIEPVESLMSRVCPACNGSKQMRRSVCMTCWSKLKKDTRNNLYQLIGNGYEEAFDAALEELRT